MLFSPLSTVLLCPGGQRRHSSPPAAGVQEGGESEEEEAGAEFVVSPPQHGHLRPGNSWRTLCQGATGDRDRGAWKTGHVWPRCTDQWRFSQVDTGETRPHQLCLQRGQQLLAVQVRIEGSQPHQERGTVQWTVYTLPGGRQNQCVHWRMRLECRISLRYPRTRCPGPG